MNRLMTPLVRLFVRWMPDAFAVALLLTFLTFALSVSIAEYPAQDALASWGDSFWNLLKFTNQITLTLLLGYALANTPPVHRSLLAIASLARTPRSAYMLACFITGVCALFSWGLSLIAAGIMARAIGESCSRNGVAVHYPLLVAASFSGFVIWHQGLSSSVGLALATPGHFLEAELGLIAISDTLFSAWNIGVALLILVSMPFVMAALHPQDASQIQPIPPALVDAADSTATPMPTPDLATTPAGRFEDSRIATWLIVAAGGAFLGLHFIGRGRGLDLNTLNFGFLWLGMLLAGSPIRYVRIIVDGGRVAAPFLLQYPFYAGIAGLMADSGLARMVIELFVSVSTAQSLPLYGFLSGGLLNLFIPSGGGQWAVQGPIMMAAAQQVGADLPRVAMSVALGDQWTNLIQPLTIIPVLTIAGVGLREIMGYTFVALLFSGAIFSIALLLP